MRASRALLLLALLGVGLTGCMIGSIGQPAGLAYPDGCGEFGLPRERCEAIVAHLARQSGVDLNDVAVIQLLGPPECKPPDDCAAARDAFVVGVRFTYWNGNTSQTYQWCGRLNRDDAFCQG